MATYLPLLCVDGASNVNYEQQVTVASIIIPNMCPLVSSLDAWQ
jgi:hypothetical protein